MPKPSNCTAHTHTDRHRATQSRTERRTHSHTHSGTHRVPNSGALTHTRIQHKLHAELTSLSLRSARLSLCCLCRCPLLSSSAHSLRLHFIQFFAWLLSLPSRRVAAAAAALQTPLLLQSTPTIEAHRQARARGEDGRRGKRSECRQNNMFVWIISYVALRCDGDTDDATATRRGDASLCAQTIGAGGSCMATPTVVRHSQQKERGERVRGEREGESKRREGEAEQGRQRGQQHLESFFALINCQLAEK